MFILKQNYNRVLGLNLDKLEPEIIGNDQIKLRLQVKETLQIYIVPINL